MKKKIVFFFCFIFFLSGFLVSIELTPVSIQESQNISQNWLRYLNEIPFRGKEGFYSIREVESIFYKGDLLAEIFHLYPSGHILVPAYQEFTPVKSFSFISNFDSKSSGFESLVLEELRACYDFLRAYEEGQIRSLEDILIDNRKSWLIFLRLDFSQHVLKVDRISEKEENSGIRENILRLGEEASIKSTIAEPLVLTRWGQKVPFWNDCPKLNNIQCPVGCVATAMAQIMRFYKWPERGVGKHSYFWTGGNRMLSANFSDPYDWKNMPFTVEEIAMEVEERAAYGSWSL